MLKHRVIPVLLFDGSYCVQTVQFKQPARKLGPMEQYVNNMSDRNVDELMILDISAGRMMRGPLFEKIKSFTSAQFCPVSYGGGIGTIDDISRLISDCGIDKVVVRSSRSLVYSAARKFGSQAIVYAIDAQPCAAGYDHYHVSKWDNIYKPKTIAQSMENEGAGEILLTGIHKQGLMRGYDISIINEISNGINVPLIANGGCGIPEDMVNAIRAGASAVAASSMFCLRGVTPQDCASVLLAAGLPARVDQEAPE